jgi:hypothetical protein
VTLRRPRRQSVVQFIQVDGWWVPVHRPAPTPKYDVFDVMGAAFAGFSLALLVLTALLK